MRIAVNTRLLLPNKLEGIGWFTYETLKRIAQQRPDDEFIFIFDRKWDEQFIFGPNVRAEFIGPPSRHPFLWYLWFERSLPPLLKKLKPDLFLSPDGYLSLNYGGPSLPVIHDINFEHYPKDLPFWYRKYYQHYFPKYAGKATRIATVSEFSKKDISDNYGIDPSLIDVVYNGVSDRFKPLYKATKNETKQNFSKGKPYFVFVGAIHPRKNIARMIQAFDQFKSSGNYPHALVLIGRKKWWTSEMTKALENSQYRAEILFHDQLSSSDVAVAVAGAEAMLYVSTFEGFGIPILEAMKSGVPVITSSVSSMPEIAGKYALLCDPFEVSSISESMQKLINEPGLSDRLIEGGLKRSEEFSWNRTAELLWSSIEKCFE